LATKFTSLLRIVVGAAIGDIVGVVFVSFISYIKIKIKVLSHHETL
jgi:ABC-type lipoprotein release transport system permease subunit